MLKPLARFFIRTLAVTGLGGVAFLYTQARSFAKLENVSARIIAGEQFKPETLATFENDLAAVEKNNACNIRLLRSSLIIRLRMLENALAQGDIVGLDGVTSRTKVIAIQSLTCSPSDAFAWFVLFWMNNFSDGFQPGNIRLLEASYQYGPHEAWIALSRNAIAFRFFSKLSPALQEKVIEEFIGLIGAQQFEAGVSVFMGPAAPYRTRLLTALAELPYAARLGFAQHLETADTEVEIPGIHLPKRNFYDERR